MKSFLRDHWPWIVVPMFLVFGALVVLVWISSGNGHATGFDYDIF